MSKLPRLSLAITIRQSLVGIIVVLAVALGIVSVRGWMATTRAQAHLQAVYQDRIVPMWTLQAVAVTYADTIVDATWKAVSEAWTPSTSAAAIRQGLKSRETYWQQFRTVASTPEEKQAIAEIQPLIDQVDTSVARLLDALDRGDKVEIEIYARDELYPRIDLLVALLHHQIDYEVYGADQNFRSATIDLQRSQAIALAFGIVSAVLLAVAVAIVVGRVIRPINAMTKAMTRLAHDDFSVDIPGENHRDEIGEMARAVQVFRKTSMEKGELSRILENEAREAVRARAAAEHALEQLRAAQAQLLQSEKLAALGGMVAGIAHEINTPLGSALTVGSTISEMTNEMKETIGANKLRRSDLDSFMERLGRACQILLATLERAGDLVRTFKQVAVDQSSDRRRAFELNEIVDHTLMTVQPMFKSTTHKIVFTRTTPINFDSFPGPLVQVITNLMTNTLAHAFEDRTGGTIQLELQPLGDQASITVRDDGRGIKPEHLPKLFDPFFTTRLGKGGSGLGLNIVYGIVTRLLGGTITVQSEFGHGAAFTVTIPLVAPGAQPQEAAA